MVMIRAIIRPEKVDETLKTLADAGYPAVTKIEAYGRGKQKGLQVGSVFYDELPKEMLMIVVDDEVEEKVCSLIIGTARTGEGNFGDGRIFVTPIKKAYTISSKTEGLEKGRECYGRNYRNCAAEQNGRNQTGTA